MSSVTPISLPKGFEDLEPFAADWALSSETARIKKRFATSWEDINIYYDAIIERIDAVLDYLDTFDIHALPPAEQHLMDMALSLVEVSNAVEVYGKSFSPHSCGPERFATRVVDREPA